MLWAENLLLLLTDARSGKLVVPWNRVDLALAGSVLDQLWRQERLAVDHPERPRRPGRIRVLDASPTGDAVLDEALGVLQATPRPPIGAIHRIKGTIRPHLYQRLQERGVLDHRRGRVLGFVPIDLWPARDSTTVQPYADCLRRWWTSAPYREATGDEECASASALLAATNALGPVLRRAGLSAQVRAVRRTALRSREASWAATAVQQIVTSQQAAVSG